jgi:hypothetical protein
VTHVSRLSRCGYLKKVNVVALGGRGCVVLLYQNYVLDIVCLDHGGIFNCSAGQRENEGDGQAQMPVVRRRYGPMNSEVSDLGKERNSIKNESQSLRQQEPLGFFGCRSSLDLGSPLSSPQGRQRRSRQFKFDSGRRSGRSVCRSVESG